MEFITSHMMSFLENVTIFCKMSLEIRFTEKNPPKTSLTCSC